MRYPHLEQQHELITGRINGNSNNVCYSSNVNLS